MAAVAARKTAAKKTAAPRAPRVARSAAGPAAEAPAPAVEGVVLDPGRPAAPPNTFPIFAIGDVQYYAPVAIPMRIELAYLWKIRHEGARLATSYLLEELLGEGYVALMNYEGLTASDMARITGLLQDVMEKASPAGPKGELRIG